MEEKLEKYARLIVKTGVNIQKNQILVINSPIECADFARRVADAAYDAGAKDVVVNWNDEILNKIRFTKAPDEVFDEFPEWRKEFYLGYARQGAAFVSIAASDPEILKDVNPDRIARTQKVSGNALKEYRERMMSNKNTWCVVSIPTKAWAQKIFPNDSVEAAVDKLWQAILQTVRVGEGDPVAAWEKHQASLKKSKDLMNAYNFKYLKYRNSIGTDLTVELPEGHIWLSGAEYTPEGREFIANMPTEEVFSMPKRNGVNGTVVSSKPLNYHGNLIENFKLTFKEGKVVEYSAEKGQAILQKILEADDSSSYLGEVALVPYDSPISNLDILFYNTLFDENASCHLAFGKAYPVCIKNGDTMSAGELEKAGVNDSLIHEDFMIGTADLEIIGVTHEGKEVTVFKNGNFAE